MSLTVLGSSIVATPSNGLTFFGIADDVKTRKFTGVSWDEEVRVIVPNPVLNSNNQLVNPYDVKVELENPNVDSSSFVSTRVPCALTPRNGVVTFVAGTPLNFDALGTGTYNAFQTFVRYSFSLPNIQGDDSTASSKMVTLWFNRFLGETTVYETNQSYGVNSNLFINECGKLTTRQAFPNSPVVAICTAPPSVLHSSLQFMLL